MSRLLLLEDDKSLVEGLQYALEKNGFELEVARTVGEAKNRLHLDKKSAMTADALAEAAGYDLLLLDVTLPDGTGFEVCEAVRASGCMVPIIFLTAADEETNIIRGLDSGGDDYITKPFKLGELCSRIRALLRRSGRAEVKRDGVIRNGDIVLDLNQCRVSRAGATLELTNAEYRLLTLLIRNAGRIMTRQTILDALWDGNGDFVDDNTLSVYIRRLREKVEEEPSAPKYLQTVRGFGYRWNGVEE